MRLSDLRLLAADYRRLFVFYRDILELPVDWGDEDSGYAQFKCGSLVLAIFERAAMAQVVSTSGLPVAAAAQDRFAISFAVEDVDAAFDQLVQKGAQKVTEPHNRDDWGYRVAHFRDPDGNLIELYAPRPASV